MWDMKQFFKATHIPDSKRVSITSIYLTSDMKLWWCTRVGDDAEFGKPEISTWETKKRVERPFFPHQHYLGGQRIIEETQTHQIHDKLCKGI